ncbi:ammonium transporter [Helicobacter burdigaliensis]|nr:ammonium transporter [Helicobacter burdigaliensis]
MKFLFIFLCLCNVVFASGGEFSSSDTVFLIFSSLLVILMTPALGLFYGGMVRKINVLNTLIVCIVVFSLVALQWIVLGYTLAFGEDNYGLIGGLEYIFALGVDGGFVGGVPQKLFMFFQMLFAIIGSAIITGAFVERMRFGVLLIFVLFWSIFVYDVLAHWVWGSGWLMKIGSLDFAGGGVVHIAAGVAGLVGAVMVGKRKSARGILPHSLPLSFIGAVFLWLGWLGFNTGSALSVNMVAVNAFINSNLAVVGAVLSWVMIEWVKFGKPTLLGSLTGIIAGLVAITPACGYVSAISALLIGFLASPICFFAISTLKAKMGYDDTLDAFGLHGVGGIWGGIATGLFATSEVNGIIAQEGLKDGLFYSGDFSLLGAQIIAVVACFSLSLCASFVILKIISFYTTLRVEDSEEENGLDQALHGEKAYR